MDGTINVLNIKLIIAYDGTHYLGWQKTRMGKSIEATLQAVLEQVLQHPVVLQAASRTDAGVHANGQVVNFFTPHFRENLGHSLNALLPKDIVVLRVERMDPDFHPTLSCTGKEYRYYICSGPVQMPQHRLYSWHYHYPLDLKAMKKAAAQFVGTHDFSSFCNVKKNSRYAHYLRTIESIELNEIEQNRLCIVIRGNNFLYKMVRNLVGTLAYVGHGKISVEEVGAILCSKNRVEAGVTAPAHGLFLESIY